VSPKIIIVGGEKLSSYIKEENLRLAAAKVSRYLGIPLVRICISNRIADDSSGIELGCWTDEYRDRAARNSRIMLYDLAIRRYCSLYRSRSIRVVYAKVLVHELVHVSQTFRGIREGGARMDFVEKEADALVPVYAPIALECLRAGII